MAEEKQKTDTVLIKNEMGQGMGAKDFLAELKQLTPEDKKQLGDGIRNGSMTY